MIELIIAFLLFGMLALAFLIMDLYFKIHAMRDYLDEFGIEKI